MDDNYANFAVIQDLKQRLQLLLHKSMVSSRRRPGLVIVLLRRLWSEPMTMYSLIRSKVGVTVNDVLKLNLSQEVSELANKLLVGWTELLNRKGRNRRLLELQKKTGSTTKRSVKFSDKLIVHNKNKNTGKGGKGGNGGEGKEEVDKENENNSTNIKVSKRISQLKALRDNARKGKGKGKKPIVYKTPEKPTIKRKFNEVYDKTKKLIENKENLNPFTRKRPTFQKRTDSQKRTAIKKLPPIGQLPQYSAQNLKAKRQELESSSEPSTSKGYSSHPSTSSAQFHSPCSSGLGGHALYKKIVNSRKRKQDFSSISHLSPSAKRAKSFGVIGCDKLNLPPFRHSAYGPDKPRVENWTIPKTKPIITPIDRLKIIKNRSLDPKKSSLESSRAPKPYKDEHEVELDVHRVRSAKSFTTNIPRKEHKPKWILK